MIKELTGKHVAIFFVFFFGIIFTVNGIMIYLSQSSWTGLETRDAYRKGLKYNQKLSKSEAQNTRGWSMELIRNDLSQGSFSLTAIPKQKDDEGLSGLNISVELKRPTHEGIDRHFSLKEKSLGVYSGKIDKVQLGQWHLIVTADRGSEILYRSKNDFELK